jgi:hypothetical protein
LGVQRERNAVLREFAEKPMGKPENPFRYVDASKNSGL